jgi:hypothetical protein
MARANGKLVPVRNLLLLFAAVGRVHVVQLYLDIYRKKEYYIDGRLDVYNTR